MEVMLAGRFEKSSVRRELAVPFVVLPAACRGAVLAIFGKAWALNVKWAAMARTSTLHIIFVVAVNIITLI